MASSGDSSSSESRKQKIIGVDDRLSALPDALVHHILSFLLAEEAIQTSVLSSRWTNLWTTIPRLNFRYLGSGLKKNKFHDSINKTLVQYASPKVQGLSFTFYYDKDLDDNIVAWLRWAIQHEASVISLALCNKTGACYQMPQFFFENSSIKKLYTRSCVYAPKKLVCWGSLKSLSILRGLLDDVALQLSSDTLQRILLGSPMLESLELFNCSGLDMVDVSSSRELKSLSLNRCKPLNRLVIGSCSKLETLVLKNLQEGDMIEIDCPSLKTLKISVSFGQKMYRLLDFPALINACLIFEVVIASEQDYVNFVKENLPRISHAEKITLGSRIVQALSRLELEGSPSHLDNNNIKCRHLTLHTSFNEQTLFGMKSLLESFPSLHTLVVNTSHEDTGKTILPNSGGNIKDVFGEKYMLRTSCLRKHLTTFKIVGLLAEEDYLFKFVGFLLREARVLENMEVSFAQFASNGTISEVREKLLCLPRSSPRAVIHTYPFKM